MWLSGAAEHYPPVRMGLPLGSTYGRHMGYERLAYDDQDTTGQMHDDCLVCATHMRLPHDALVPELVGDLSVPVAGDHVAVPKPRKEIEVSEAAAHLASRLHLHLD